MPTPVVPCIHRKNVIGFRGACERMWGRAGYDAVVARLPEDVRRATAGLVPVEKWVPTAFLVAWANAVWSGPAQFDESTMRAYVAHTVDHGFGLVRQMLLSLVTPVQLAQRAPSIWREEYTTGRLDPARAVPGDIELVLQDHPYVETRLMRLCIAEAFRHLGAKTRAKGIVERHWMQGPLLRIQLTWDVGAARK